MSDTTLVVKRRETRGKNAGRRTRGDGDIPAVVYGQAVDPISIQVANKKIQRLLRDGGDNAVFLLQLEGTDQSRHVMVKDIQYNYRNGHLLHIDFQRIDMDEKVQVNVPVELIGIPIGVKTDGGMVDFVNREIEIECLPGDIPEHLELDISELRIGQHLEAKDVPLGKDRVLLDDEAKVILSIKAARIEEEVEETEEGEVAEDVTAEEDSEGEDDSSS